MGAGMIPFKSALILLSAVLAGSLTVNGGPVHAATVKVASLDKKVSVSGAGSSAISNLVDQCRTDMNRAYGTNIGYQPSGSGAGRSGFIAKTVDFAGSDVPFKTSELPLLKTKFVYVPVALGGVAVVYRLEGVSNLKLSPVTLAKIFSGTVTQWSHPIIKAENPGVKLPSQTIRVIVRSDSSGTSQTFSHFLTETAGKDWAHGATSSFPVPPRNGLAQKGSDGVSNYVAGPTGSYSISYAETSFATERKLGVVSVINEAGKAVAPQPGSITVAAKNGKVNPDGTVTPDFRAVDPLAYPIFYVGYIIAPTAPEPKKGDVLRAFLTHTVGGCQTKATKLGYAPLPANITKKALENINKINPGSLPSPTVPAAR